MNGWNSCGTDWGELIIQTLAGLVGVFVGAYLAFRNERTKDEAKAKTERAAAANLAAHTLGQMYSAMKQYQQEVVEPTRKSPARWLEMRPSALYVGQPLTFDMPALQFLFASNDADVVNQLAVEARRFANSVHTAGLRADMHINELQTAVERTGTRLPAPVSTVEAAAGPRVVAILKEYTERLIEDIDLGVASTLELQGRLRESALPLVGNNKLIRLKPV